MGIWSDLYKLFTYSSEQNPLEKQTDKNNLRGAGYVSASSIPTDTGETLGHQSLRESTDMVDLQSVNGRMGRYAEYEKLQIMPEIDTAMTTIADEACFAGDTPVMTPFGAITIEQLTKTKKPEERFLVYSFDTEKKDYTLAWAYHPRYVKTAPTVRLMLDDGTSYRLTPDHRVLLRTGVWCEAGKLRFGDELMPFYRKQPNAHLTRLKTGQFPRIYTLLKGWMNERQFTDEWRNGKTTEKADIINQATRMICQGVHVRSLMKILKKDWKTLETWIGSEGFSHRELVQLTRKYKDRRRVVGVVQDESIPVYDLSVEKNQCFCTDSCVFHNCQEDSDGNIFKITLENETIRKELNYIMFNRKRLNMNRRGHELFRSMCVKGDVFLEKIIDPDNPEEGLQRVEEMPQETMFRLETNRGRLLEFQQSNQGPDLTVLNSSPTSAPDPELKQNNVTRFHPKQIAHIRIGGKRNTFYPYGVSLIEPARNPAHQLRLLEDAMVTYRLVRAPERRVYYIDTGTLSPNKATQYVERLKSQLRKKKVGHMAGALAGANQVEERWQPPAVDEDIWVPTRTGSNTRIDTLQGAQNLGEIDDAIYFRQKLYMALNFPMNYLQDNTDPTTNRLPLSARNPKFAHMIERLQSCFVDGLLDICEHHCELKGYPPELYHDLKIKMTPPSDWRVMARAEAITSKIGWATQYKSAGLMSDYDIYRDVLEISEEKTKEMLARNKVQKLEDLKMAVVAQNPTILGIGVPGVDPHPGQEIGAEAGGPNPNMAPEGEPPADPSQMGGQGEQPQDQIEPPKDERPDSSGRALPIPSKEDIAKYDLEIQDYGVEQDQEDIDYSIGDN